MRRATRRFAPAPAVALLVFAACTDETRTLPVPYALSASPRLPFPSDAMLVPDASTPTGLALHVGPKGTNLGDVDEALYLFGDVMAHALDPLDGWSLEGSAFVELPAPPDVASLDGHLLLVDLEARAIVPGTASVVTGTTAYRRPVTWAELAPTRPLREATKHAVLLLRGARAEDGTPYGPSPDLQALLAGRTDVPGDPARVAAARARLTGLSDTVRAINVAPEDVLVAETFTTESVRPHAVELAAAYRAAPVGAIDLDPDGDGSANVYDAPTADPAWTGAAEGDYPHVGRVARFAIEVPSFRATEDGPLVYTAGAPVLQRWTKVTGLLALPVGAGPWPVVRYQHGLGDVKESLWRYVDGLAAAGVAAVAFDAPLHGERTEHPERADGRFIDYSDARLISTNLQEAEAESVYLARVVDALAATELGRDLRPERQLWVGNSLGAILGPGAIALEPRYEGAALMVGGGKLSEVFDAQLGGLAAIAFPMRLSLAAIQAALDRGDPASWAADLEGRQLLLLQAMEDDTIPAASTEALGRALDLPIVAPAARAVPGVEVVAAPASGRGWLQFPGGTHALTHHAGPHPEVYARARASLFHFVETWAASGRGEIR